MYVQGSTENQFLMSGLPVKRLQVDFNAGYDRVAKPANYNYACFPMKTIRILSITLKI